MTTHTLVAGEMQERLAEMEKLYRRRMENEVHVLLRSTMFYYVPLCSIASLFVVVHCVVTYA